MRYRMISLSEFSLRVRCQSAVMIISRIQFRAKPTLISKRLTTNESRSEISWLLVVALVRYLVIL